MQYYEALPLHTDLHCRTPHSSMPNWRLGKSLCRCWSPTCFLGSIWVPWSRWGNGDLEAGCSFLFISNLLGGVNMCQPFWKMMEFVSWEYILPSRWKNKKMYKNVPNHQPVMFLAMNIGHGRCNFFLHQVEEPRIHRPTHGLVDGKKVGIFVHHSLGQAIGWLLDDVSQQFRVISWSFDAAENHETSVWMKLLKWGNGWKLRDTK